MQASYFVFEKIPEASFPYRVILGNLAGIITCPAEQKGIWSGAMFLIRLHLIFSNPAPERLVRNLHLCAKPIGGIFPCIVHIKDEANKTVAVGGMPTNMGHQRTMMFQAEKQNLFAQPPAFLFPGDVESETGLHTGRPGSASAIFPKTSSICFLRSYTCDRFIWARSQILAREPSKLSPMTTALSCINLCMAIKVNLFSWQSCIRFIF